jgi:hypothetical protein
MWLVRRAARDEWLSVRPNMGSYQFAFADAPGKASVFVSRLGATLAARKMRGGGHGGFVVEKIRE